jgi:hypothetical protein
LMGSSIGCSSAVNGSIVYICISNTLQSIDLTDMSVSMTVTLPGNGQSIDVQGPSAYVAAQETLVQVENSLKFLFTQKGGSKHVHYCKQCYYDRLLRFCVY